MKKVLIVLIAQMFFLTPTIAQNTELSIHLNSGLFSFSGESATKESIIFMGMGNYDGKPFTLNPYGSKTSLSYGLTIQAQHITSFKLLLGIQAGYEIHQSRVEIPLVYERSSNRVHLSTGYTNLIHTYINAFPHIGYRLIIEDIILDLTVGPEIGSPTSSTELGKAKLEDGRTIESNIKYKNYSNDFRLRSNITTYIYNFGVSVGYSYGLSDYNEMSSKINAYSRLIRFGILYKL